jgi:hypothetical protein
MKQHQKVPTGGRGPAEPIDDVRQRTTGILPGTIVLTARGEQVVEALKPGDRIITRDAGFIPLRGISVSKARVRTYRILAGSLGHTRPEEDLDLPAGQKILVRDWRAKALFGKTQALAEVETLTDGEFITDLGMTTREVWHLTFDQPHIIFAGGIELGVPDTEQPEYHDAA